MKTIVKKGCAMGKTKTLKIKGESMIGADTLSAIQ